MHVRKIEPGVLTQLVEPVLQQADRDQIIGFHRRIGRAHAGTVLETEFAVASLRAFRAFIKNTRATKPFIGFGDPALGDEAGQNRGLELSSFYRGPLANVEAVRKLGSLPRTAQELKTVAKYLGQTVIVSFFERKPPRQRLRHCP